MTGHLRVGVDQAPPSPLCCGLPDTAEFQGFEVDLLRDLAGRLGVTLSFSSALWSGILADLQAGRLDLICAAATITDERRRTVAFSEPYLEGTLALVTRRKGPPVGLESLAGRTVGVRVATVAEAFVRTRCSAAHVEGFDLNVGQYDALRRGLLDAVVDDEPIAAYFARAAPDILRVRNIPGTRFEYGIVVARDNDPLRTAVNGALAAMRKDGTLSRLKRGWLA